MVCLLFCQRRGAAEVAGWAADIPAFMIPHLTPVGKYPGGLRRLAPPPCPRYNTDDSHQVPAADVAARHFAPQSRLSPASTPAASALPPPIPAWAGMDFSSVIRTPPEIPVRFLTNRRRGPGDAAFRPRNGRQFSLRTVPRSISNGLIVSRNGSRRPSNTASIYPARRAPTSSPTLRTVVSGGRINST